MQRYNELYDPYTGALELDDNGAYVLAEEAQAEIDALHAECDRLTAMLGNQSATPQEEDQECHHEYSYESRGPYLCLWVCKKCGEVLDED